MNCLRLFSSLIIFMKNYDKFLKYSSIISTAIYQWGSNKRDIVSKFNSVSDIFLYNYNLLTLFLQI